MMTAQYIHTYIPYHTTLHSLVVLNEQQPPHSRAVVDEIDIDDSSFMHLIARIRKPVQRHRVIRVFAMGTYLYEENNNNTLINV